MNIASSAPPNPNPTSALVDDQDDHGAQQSEPDREHPGDTPGAERDAHRLAQTGLTGRVGRADVRTHREPHTDVPRDRREPSAQDERDRTSELDRELGVLGVGRRRQQEEKRHGQDGQEYGERPELAGQVGLRALLDGLRDLAHLGSAFRRRQHLPDQVPREQQRDDRDPEDDPQRGLLGAAEHGLDRAALLGKPTDHRTSHW
jgi:hypothetical protein